MTKSLPDEVVLLIHRLAPHRKKVVKIPICYSILGCGNLLARARGYSYLSFPVKFVKMAASSFFRWSKRRKRNDSYIRDPRRMNVNYVKTHLLDYFGVNFCLSSGARFLLFFSSQGRMTVSNSIFYRRIVVPGLEEVGRVGLSTLILFIVRSFKRKPRCIVSSTTRVGGLRNDVIV